MSNGQSLHDIPKAILYSWPSSVWSTVPKLCLWEKGYHQDEYENKLVDLDNGENFSPQYLRINQNGTVPTLVVPTIDSASPNVEDRFRSLRDTITICDFLDQARTPNSVSRHSPRPAPALSPATIEGKIVSNSIIALVHLPTIDPNFLNLTARTAADLDIKSKGFPGTMLQSRHDNFIRYIDQAKAAGDGPFEQHILSLIEEKLAANDSLLGVFKGTAPKERVDAFFDASQRAWRESVPDALQKLEENILGPFVLGEQISLADLHIISWLTRIISIANGKPDETGFDSLLPHLDGRTAGGPKLKAFWQSWVKRESFQKVLVEVYGTFQSTVDG